MWLTILLILLGIFFLGWAIVSFSRVLKKAKLELEREELQKIQKQEAAERRKAEKARLKDEDEAKQKEIARIKAEEKSKRDQARTEKEAKRQKEREAYLSLLKNISTLSDDEKKGTLQYSVYSKFNDEIDDSVLSEIILDWFSQPITELQVDFIQNVVLDGDVFDVLSDNIESMFKNNSDYTKTQYDKSVMLLQINWFKTNAKIAILDYQTRYMQTIKIEPISCDDWIVDRPCYMKTNLKLITQRQSQGEKYYDMDNAEEYSLYLFDDVIEFVGNGNWSIDINSIISLQVDRTVVKHSNAMLIITCRNRSNIFLWCKIDVLPQLRALLFVLRQRLRNPVIKTELYGGESMQIVQSSEEIEKNGEVKDKVEEVSNGEVKNDVDTNKENNQSQEEISTEQKIEAQTYFWNQLMKELERYNHVWTTEINGRTIEDDVMEYYARKRNIHRNFGITMGVSTIDNCPIKMVVEIEKGYYYGFDNTNTQEATTKLRKVLSDLGYESNDSWAGWRWPDYSNDVTRHDINFWKFTPQSSVNRLLDPNKREAFVKEVAEEMITAIEELKTELAEEGLS